MHLPANRFQSLLRENYQTLLDRLKIGAVDLEFIADNERLLVQKQIAHCAWHAGANTAEPGEITFTASSLNKFSDSATNALNNFFEVALALVDVRADTDEDMLAETLGKLHNALKQVRLQKSIVGKESACVEAACILALSKPGLLAGDIIQTLQNRPDKPR